MVNSLKRYQKKEHYDQLFCKIGKNSQLSWNIANIIRKTNNHTEITESLCGNRKITDPSEICTLLNNHFVTAGHKVKENILPRPDNCDLMVFVKRITKCMLFKPVSEQHICNIVKKLKPKKSCGYDISNALLIRLIDMIKMPVCYILNKSLTGLYPDLMKISKVVPLHKGGNNMADNYRPISLLPVTSKVLERVMYYFLVQHLDKNNILYP